MKTIEWFFCWCAFRLVLALPNTSPWHLRLLPFAGVYAYTDGGLAEYRRDRSGFCTMATGEPVADFDLGI